jgi:hypothetical protein
VHKVLFIIDDSSRAVLFLVLAAAIAFRIILLRQAPDQLCVQVAFIAVHLFQSLSTAHIHVEQVLIVYVGRATLLEVRG